MRMRFTGLSAMLCRPGHPRQGRWISIGRAVLGATVLWVALLASGMAFSQSPGPQAARQPVLAVPEIWKVKLNENTVSIMGGSPSETYLEIIYDLTVALNDGDNLRVLPIVGLGGAQNIKDVLYLRGVDAGITSVQMLRHFASTRELDGALDQRLTYIAKLFSEEMHIIVGPDIKRIEDLNGKKVNICRI